MKKVSLIIGYLMCLFTSCKTNPTEEINPKSKGDWEITSTVYFPEFNNSMEVKTDWERRIIPTISLGDTLWFSLVQNTESIFWKVSEKDFVPASEHIIQTYTGVVQKLSKKSEDDGF